MGVGPEQYKAALGQWATGVAIVTSRAGDEVHGMTVSDFCGASLDPPLVLVCADRASNTLGVVERGGVFAVNLLAADQQALSDKFASRKEELRRFDGLACSVSVTGAPILPGALLSLDCRVVDTHEAGDHVILVGRVEAVVQGRGEPLLYHGGAYRSLASE
jgi:flavin reductase (DIM6/NTAB) family NADH-FMN oxidoreductase RutF